MKHVSLLLFLTFAAAVPFFTEGKFPLVDDSMPEFSTEKASLYKGRSKPFEPEIFNSFSIGQNQAFILGGREILNRNFKPTIPSNPNSIGRERDTLVNKTSGLLKPNIEKLFN